MHNLPGTTQDLPGGSKAIPGWTTTDTGVEWYRPLADNANPAPDGLYAGDLANLTFSAGGLQQTIAAQPGAVQMFAFMLGTDQTAGRDGTCEVVVAADGVTETFTVINHANLTVYTPCVFTFAADGASATVQLRCLQYANLHFAIIDAATLNLSTTSVPDNDGSDPVESAWGTVKALFR